MSEGAIVAGAQPRVSNRLDRAMADGRPAMICYLPIGDPSAPEDLVDVYIENGVDVLEIGIPVANPYLDGPIIRDSMERVRRAGVDARKIAMMTAQVRRRHPEQAMVWMSYAPAIDDRELVRLAKRAGVDGVLFVEPARMLSSLAGELAKVGVHLLHFMPRDLPRGDVAAARASGGYVMLQAVAGRTGAGDGTRRLPDSSDRIRQLRRAGVKTPIALGIGIHSPAQARQAVRMGASGVIIGSELVRLARRGSDTVAQYLKEIREALS